MTALTKLLRTTAFRLSLIYFGLFAATATLAVGYIYYRTGNLLSAQLETALQTELRNLNSSYRDDGIDGLKEALDQRSKTPGNHLYLLADVEGRHLSGNLKAVSQELWNSTGAVAFYYRRATPARIEERFAVAVVLRLTNGNRLVVGRDIDDQRQFGEAIRTAFLWALGGMILFGLGGGFLISQNLLRRIEGMTAATHNIMQGELSKRLPIAGKDDEFDRLAVNVNMMLARIEELVSGFKEVSDNIAHDLRTPLNRLRNRVEDALRENGDTEHYRNALRSTIEDADDLIRTFNALLSIARLESGAGERIDEKFDLAIVLQDVVELYEPLAEEQGISLKLGEVPSTPIAGKRELVAQALANILDNAIKYGVPAKPGGNNAAGEISVDMSSTELSVQITVADRGPGINEEDRKRVLKRFVRLETSRSMPGSGLGLSLVAAVARLHGGELSLSDNNPGLIVHFTIKRNLEAMEKKGAPE